MNVLESNESMPEQTRLRRIAPASLKINREEMDWKATAIPLLSPLVLSPDQINFSTYNTSLNNDPSSNNSKDNQRKEETVKPHGTTFVAKRWQHPAAPFCYEAAPLVPFVCSGCVERLSICCLGS